MKAQAFYTASQDFVNRTIIRVAKALYAHIGLLFTATEEEFEKLKEMLPAFHWDEITPCPDGLYRFFFESIWKKDKRTGKTGVRGPYPFRKLARWKGVSTKRKLHIQDLPLTSDEAIDMIPFLCNAVIEIKYARKQLYFNWKQMRFGMGIALKKRTPKHWTCIETMLMAIAYVNPALAISVLKIGHYLFEEIPPSHSDGWGFYEMIEQHKKDNQ